MTDQQNNASGSAPSASSNATALAPQPPVPPLNPVPPPVPPTPVPTTPPSSANPAIAKPPGWQFQSGNPITPADWRKVVDSRVIDDSKWYKGPLHANFASNTVQGAPSIVELARALKNDPQLIFEFVYENIEWEPGIALQKGALGCLLDGMGNSFDQSALLVALLRQAGFTASYVYGTIQLSEAQFDAWFNTTSIWAAYNYCGNENIPANSPTWNGSIYQMVISHCWVQVVVSGTTYVLDPSLKTYTRKTGVSNLATILGYTPATFLSDAESGATIDGSGNYVQNMNSKNIRADLQTMTSNLVTYIKNNAIGSAPAGTATVDDVLGGQAIVPLTLPFTWQTSLSYEAPGDVPTIWTGDVPNTYKTTLQVQYPLSTGGWSIDQTFTSDQLAGSRLTVFFNGLLQPVLALNGVTVATGEVQGVGTWNSILLTVTHNGYPVTWYNQQWWQSFIYAGQYYLIGNAWGNLGRGQLDFHLQQYAANVAAGGSSTSEPVLGEALAVTWFTWAAQASKVTDLVNRIMNCHTMNNHAVGMVSYEAGPELGTDIGGVSSSSTNLNNDTTKTPINDTVSAMHGVAIEGATAMQLTGSGTAACTTTVIDKANRTANITIAGTVTVGDTLTISVHDPALSGGVKSDSYTVVTGDTLTSIAAGLTSALNADSSLSAIGVTATSSGAVILVSSASVNQTTYTSSTSGGATETIAIAFSKIYKGTSSNWNTGIDVANILTANGFNSADMANLNTWYISGGDSVVIEDYPTQTVDSWQGWGYWVFPSSGAFGIINGGLKGVKKKGTVTPPVKKPTKGKDNADPIDQFTGAFGTETSDMTIGSQDFPYQLSFGRIYSSAFLNIKTPLGWG